VLPLKPYYLDMKDRPPPKKRLFVDVAPEVLLVAPGDGAASQRASRLRREGRVRPLYRGVYNTNLAATDEDVVARNWSRILAYLAPGVVLSHRSAFDMAPHSGELFISRAKGRRDFHLPGLTVRATVRSDRDPLLDATQAGARDVPYGDLYVASQARAYLECLTADARQASRLLPVAEVERRLEHMLAVRGERSLKGLRDAAREVADRLDLAVQFIRLDKLIGALLGTRPARHLSSPPAIARALGMPYDEQRLNLFERIAGQLRIYPFADLGEPARAGRARDMFAFVESYFSNYIEGTTFTVEEAEDIVFKGKLVPQRHEDSHDVRGTFDAAARDPFYSQPPATEEAFLEWIRQANGKLMGARAAATPGEWKQRPNQAGNTFFVLPELVEGTLRKAWPLFATMDLPMQRALLAMFVVSEVHPFQDGNGRTARLLMNSFLSSARQCRIIVPTVFREDYLLPLKALTHQGDATGYVRAMRLCQAWSEELNYDVDMPAMRAQLMACNATQDDARVYALLSPKTGQPMTVPP
jgi:hypothetical protein